MKKVRLRKKDISYIRYSTLRRQLEIGLNSEIVYILIYPNVNTGYFIYRDIYMWLFNTSPTGNPSIRIDYKYKKSRGYRLNLEKSQKYEIKSPNNVQ